MTKIYQGSLQGILRHLLDIFRKGDGSKMKFSMRSFSRASRLFVRAGAGNRSLDRLFTYAMEYYGIYTGFILLYQTGLLCTMCRLDLADQR